MMHLHRRSYLYGLPAAAGLRKGYGSRCFVTVSYLWLRASQEALFKAPRISTSPTGANIAQKKEIYSFCSCICISIYFLHGQHGCEHIAGAIASTDHAAKPQVLWFRAADPGGAVSRWTEFSHDQLCSGPDDVLQKACHMHITFWQQSEGVRLPRQWFGVFILVAFSGATTGVCWCNDRIQYLDSVIGVIRHPSKLALT